jgi:hypothetical protein
MINNHCSWLRMGADISLARETAETEKTVELNEMLESARFYSSASTIFPSSIEDNG